MVYLHAYGNRRMVTTEKRRIVEFVAAITYSLSMSNPYKEGQTHMSRRRRPRYATPCVEAGPHAPVTPSPYETSGYRHDAVPTWLVPILQGITLVMLIGFAFWFGALSKTVEQTSKAVEELRASNEHMGNRLTAIETMVESMDNRLTVVETKVESMDNRLTVIETTVNSVDKKLDRVAKPRR